VNGNERKGVGDVTVACEFELAPVDSPTRAATTAARLARSRVVRLLCHHLLCVSANWLFTQTVPPSSGPPSASPRRASMVVAMLVASTRPPVSSASLAWVVRAELCGGAVVPQLCLSTASTTRSSSQISEDDTALCFRFPSRLRFFGAFLDCSAVDMRAARGVVAASGQQRVGARG
jgi:hypothetical protein